MKQSLTESRIDLTKITTVDNSQLLLDSTINTAENKKYTALSRNDFDMKVIDNWCEIRTKMQPKRRTFHSSFVYKEYFYIYGGVDIMSGKLNDFCRINLTGVIPQWEEIIPRGEPTQSLAYHKGCEYEGIYYIIGGQDYIMKSVNTVYAYDILTNTLEKLNFKEEDFPPVESHSANLCANQKQIIIFGGYSIGKFTNNVYSFNINDRSFIKLNKGDCIPAPQERINHSAVIHDDNLFIYAGESRDSQFLNDMWMFSLLDKNWTEIKLSSHEIPEARSGHSIVAYRDMFFIFGGKKGNLRETNEFWSFDPIKKEFNLIHDTLLEQFSEKELLEMQPKDEDKGKNHKVFKWVTKKDIPALNPLFRVKDKKRKKKIENVLSRSHVMNEYKKKWESELSKFVDVSSIQRSTIYNIEDNIEKIQSTLTNTMISSKNPIIDISIVGNVPFPRDGQSVEVYNNLIIIFGGDRNKFPYNDLYSFNIS